jgi:hypothetical protein
MYVVSLVRFGNVRSVKKRRIFHRWKALNFLRANVGNSAGGITYTVAKV